MTKGALTGEYMGFNVFSIIPLVVYGIFIKYLYDLENKKNCNCALTNNRKVLKNLLLIFVGLQVVLFLLTFVLEPLNFNALLMVLSIVNMFLFITFSVYFYNYELELKNNNCNCANDNRKRFFRYYLLFTYGLVIIQLLFLSYYSVFILKNKNRISKRKL